MADDTLAPGGGTGDTTPWYAKVDADFLKNAKFEGPDAMTEYKGYVANRGWDKLTPDQVALQAMQSHHAAEKVIGIPADQLLRMPKDAADAEGWTRFNERVGVPADGKYDFTNVKLTGDKPLPAALTEALAPALQAARVGKDAAPEVAKAIAKYLDTQDTAAATDRTAALNAERESLKINWGSNVEANMLVAKQAATALGVDEKAVQALENTIGYAKVMEMFRNIGSKIGEDKFVTNQAPGGSGVMSAEQAVATLAAKQNDVSWVTKLGEGDATVLKEFHNLTTIIAASRRAA